RKLVDADLDHHKIGAPHDNHDQGGQYILQRHAVPKRTAKANRPRTKTASYAYSSSTISQMQGTRRSGSLDYRPNRRMIIYTVYINSIILSWHAPGWFA